MKLKFQNLVVNMLINSRRYYSKCVNVTSEFKGGGQQFRYLLEKFLEKLASRSIELISRLDELNSEKKILKLLL